MPGEGAAEHIENTPVPVTATVTGEAKLPPVIDILPAKVPVVDGLKAIGITAPEITPPVYDKL